jgi:hypothetical protein
MKKFSKKTNAILLTAAIIGVILTGVGGAIAFFEVQSLEVIAKNTEYKLVEETKTISLPQTSKAKTVVYSDGALRNVTIDTDESVPENQLEVNMQFYEYTDTTPNIYLAMDMGNYLYNRETDNFSTYPVTELKYSIGFDSTHNDWDDFKTALNNLKQRKVYVDKGSDRFDSTINVNIKVNPKEKDKISVVGAEYEIITESEKEERLREREEEGENGNSNDDTFTVTEDDDSVIISQEATSDDDTFTVTEDDNSVIISQEATSDDDTFTVTEDDDSVIVSK